MRKKSERIILFQGTFRPLNTGHIRAFKMCKERGGTLIIALNTDKLVRSYKKQEPVVPYVEVKEMLESIKYIDKVVPAPHFSPMELLIKHKANVYAVGYEWVEAHPEEIRYIKENGGEIIVLPDFGLTRSSEIKRRILKGN
jgi:glycerol-3-phosphate cytidylyltransferase